MIDAEEVGRLAALLAAAERDVRPIPPLTAATAGFSSDDAYRVQLANVERRLASGERLVGAKVGLTAKVMQDQLGVDEPDFGHLFDSMVHRSGVRLEAARYCAPRVELELAFVLGAELRGPNCSLEDVVAATERVVPALELIDSRIADWKIRLADTVADNASSAGVVLGSGGVAPDALDLSRVEARLWKGGALAAEGRSDAVLGNPALAVAWVADQWARLGSVLQPGWVVMPGSCTAAVAVATGDEVVAELDGVGRVEVAFA
ncbi:MAG: 2-oxopent-4-enoate hydratase [Acidimicrobiaceae bacterium]|nr:2-oxopent-4-enoate hydratase [Acidimicrobiaceae bacterium]